MDFSWRVALPVLAAILATASLILLTPLRHAPLVEPTIDDIEPVEFYEEFVANPEKFVFIDVRPETSYRNVHAKGSINMPLHTLYDERHRLPMRGKEVILICSGGRASGVGYSYLEHYGFFNVRRVAGGIERWNEAGLPVEGENLGRSQ